MFARGPAVAVLILLDSEGKTYAVLTEQVSSNHVSVHCCSANCASGSVNVEE